VNGIESEVTQLNFNLLIFIEVSAALHKIGFSKIRDLKKQLYNSQLY